MRHIWRRLTKPLFGCTFCYHYSTLSQFGGDPKGRRARGFYGTYRVRDCGKHHHRHDNFRACDDYDFTPGFGAGFEGYDRDKSKDMSLYRHAIHVSDDRLNNPHKYCVGCDRPGGIVEEGLCLRCASEK